MHSQKPLALLSLVNECSANNGYNAHREAFSPAAALRANIWPLFLMRTCLSAARVFLKHRFHQGWCSILPRTQAAGSLEILLKNANLISKRRENCETVHCTANTFSSLLHDRLESFNSYWHSAKHIIVLLSAPRNQNSIYFLLLKVNLLPGDFKLNLKYWCANGLAFLGEHWKLKGLKLALPEATSSMSFNRRTCCFFTLGYVLTQM